MWDGMRGADSEDTGQQPQAFKLEQKVISVPPLSLGLTHLTASKLAAGNDHGADLSGGVGAKRGVCGWGGFPAAVAAAAPRTGGELATVSCLSLSSDCKRTFR